MKGIRLVDNKKLEETDILDNYVSKNQTKVKVTKALITYNDILRYYGEIETNNVNLGSFGIGVISTDENNSNIESGSKVYIDSIKNSEEDNVNSHIDSNLLFAAEDYDGFLSDFIICNNDMLHKLPESISDDQAIFIGHISLAISVIDQLDVKKGDYIGIVGGNIFGNILAQLLIYYQAVPIMMTYKEDHEKMAQLSGIYYVLSKNDNWQKEVNSISGGRMLKSIVYVSDSNIPVNKAFSVAALNATIAFAGISYKSLSISFTQAFKKQLNIKCINYSSKNIATSINLLVNKAINFDHFHTEKINYSNVISKFSELNEQSSNDEDFDEIIVENI